ncbi:hypothetical protein OWM07_06520 [Deferribacter thermophilus]|uniref:hypothetical protein n=1 Tax=Deferribacter thermophilus TaxID=53573 RepID=UPI003C20E3E5
MPRFRSIKREIFKTIFFNSLIIILSFGIFIAILAYDTTINQVRSYLIQKNLSYKYLIEGYFIKFYNYIKVISSDPKVRNIFMNKEGKNYVLKLLRNFEKADKDINYIYIGLPDGSLIINGYEPPPNYNATVRPWYKIALKNIPEISEGLPYQEIKTKEWLVSLSKVLLDDNKISVVL